MEKQMPYDPRPDRHFFPSMSNMLRMEKFEPFNPPRVTPPEEVGPIIEDQADREEISEAIKEDRGWKICNQKTCHLAGQLQPPSSYHKGSGICKICKQDYDAKYKAAKTAGILKNERRATAPEKELCLVRASHKIPNAQTYYMLSEQDVKTNIINGNIKSGDVIIKVKTISRCQLKFEMVDI